MSVQYYTSRNAWMIKRFHSVKDSRGVSHNRRRKRPILADIGPLLLLLEMMRYNSECIRKTEFFGKASSPSHTATGLCWVRQNTLNTLQVNHGNYKSKILDRRASSMNGNEGNVSQMMLRLALLRMNDEQQYSLKFFQ